MKLKRAELVKLAKQQAKEELGLVSAYDKVVAKMNLAGKTVQNLNAKKASGQKLSDKEQSELKQSTKEFTKYQNAVLKADASIGRFQRNVGNYPKGLKAAAGAARSLASALGAVGGAFLFVQAMRNAIGVMKSFEKQNATLSAILQEEKEEMSGLRDEAIRLGSTTVKTASQVTELQIAYARLGFAQSDIINLTAATIDGSIAMNSELSKTATLVGAVVNTFDDLSTSDAPKILDILSLATAKSALDFSKLETGIPIVAGAANAAGIPFTKLVALMGKLSDSGIDVSTSSTSLRNIFIAAAAEGLDYGEILEKIKGSQDKLTASNDAFGKRAAVSATVLAKNIDTTNELDEALNNAAGTAKRMADKELNTLDGAVKLLQSAWEGYILSIDDANNASSTIKDVVKSLSENLATIINTVINLGKVWVAYKITLALAWTQQKLMNLALIQSKRAAIASSIGVSKMTLTWKAFNTVLKANALGIAIAALYGLYEILSKVSKTAAKTAEALHDTTQEFTKQYDSIITLGAGMRDMSDRYDELTSKTELNKEEQKELDKIIKEISKSVPDAVTEVDKYGNALVINTGKVRDFNKENGKIATLQAQVNIQNIEKNLIKLEKAQNLVNNAFTDSGEAFQRANGLYIEGIGIVKRIGEQYFTSNKFTKENIKLTTEQQLVLEKYLLSQEKAIETTKEDIKANEDVIASVTGVKNARQLKEEQTKKDAAANLAEIAVVKKLRKEINELKTSLRTLTKDGYEDLNQAQIDLIQTTRDGIKQREDELNKIFDKKIKNKKTKREKTQTLLELIGLPTTEEARVEFEKYGNEIVKVLKDNFDIDDRDLLPSVDLSEIEIKNAPMSDELMAYYKKNFMFTDEEMDLISSQFDAIGDLYGIDGSKFTALFDQKENTVSDYVLASGEAMKGLYNSFSHNYEADLESLRTNGEIALRFAGDNAEARAEIQDQLAERERKIKRKQAKEEKQIAMFSAIVNTAAAVVSALKDGGIPLAVVVGALGAIEIAAIASQEIPQFKEGVRNFQGGLAVLGDGGVSEYARTPDGNVFKTPAKDTLYNLPKGTDVFKNESDFMMDSKRMTDMNNIMFDTSLINIPDMPDINIDYSGISKDEYSRGVNKIVSTIKNNSSLEINYSERGIETYIKYKNSRTQILNNKVRFKGKNV